MELEKHRVMEGKGRLVIFFCLKIIIIILLKIIIGFLFLFFTLPEDSSIFQR